MALPEKELTDEVKQSGLQPLTPPSLGDELPLLLEGNAKGDTSSDALPEVDGSGGSYKEAEVMPSRGRRKRRGESNADKKSMHGSLESIGTAEVVIEFEERSWRYPDEVPSFTPKKPRSAACVKKDA